MKLFYNYPLIGFCILIMGLQGMKAQQTIKGTVSDNTGTPLPGASVVVKGTTNGTQTDFDGVYSLNEVAADATMIFSYIGFTTIEVNVANQTVIDLIMKEDSQQLDEVVVVGYGTQKKSDLTGALTSVSSKDYEKQPVTRIDQALQGRSAGVQVNQVSGAPGAGFKIRIRGTNSINGSNEPLYVIDGIAVSDINAINVNDIKSMEILKDASATAIYGSRGANGVVLVTTKKGRQGKARIELNMSTGMQQVSKRLDIMNAAEFAETVNLADAGASFSEAEIAAFRSSGGTDWQDEIFKTAPMSNLQMGVSGGNEDIDYYLSANHVGQEGIVQSQNYRRYSLRSNINAKLNENLSLGFNIYGSREERRGVATNINNAVTFDPTTPVYDENGDYNFSSVNSVGTSGTNPLLYAFENRRKDFDNRVIANLSLGYKLTNSLTFRTTFGSEFSNSKDKLYIPIIVNQTGNATITDINRVNLQNTNVLNYSKEFGDDHGLQIDLVHEQQHNKWDYLVAESENFATDLTGFQGLELGKIQRTSNELNNMLPSDQSLQSFLGRINYVLKNRYLLTASLRADGSSKFRKENRWGYFPSASLAWKITEEDFMLGSAFTSLKPRISYGVTGSQAIDALATRARSITGEDYNYPFDGGAGITGIAPSNRIENPDLTWEKTKQINAGIDIGLWASRLTLSLDWYQKNTTDLLLDVVLPEFVGANIITRNVGEIENKGFEINLGAKIIEGDDFSWNADFNFSRNRNKVLSLIDGIDFINAGRNNYLGQGVNNIPPTRVEVGQPLSTFRGYVYEGVYQTGETTIEGRKAGDPKYKDIDGDGAITAVDVVNIGNGAADYTWGLNSFMSYKNFDLNVLVQGSEGNDVYNFVRARQNGLGTSTFNGVHKDLLNSWTPSNASNIPAFDKTASSHQILSTQFLEDASFIRFKNISLGYNFSSELLESIKLQSLRLYVTAENLITITDYSGYDPEISSSGSSDVDLGIDQDAYPLAKIFSFGVNLSF